MSIYIITNTENHNKDLFKLVISTKTQDEIINEQDMDEPYIVFQYPCNNNTDLIHQKLKRYKSNDFYKVNFITMLRIVINCLDNNKNTDKHIVAFIKDNYSEIFNDHPEFKYYNDVKKDIIGQRYGVDIDTVYRTYIGWYKEGEYQSKKNLIANMGRLGIRTHGNCFCGIRKR